jgi:hypothetical protein
MSMYTHLLETALARRPEPDGQDRTSSLLDELERSRRRLHTPMPAEHSAERVPAAVADQLSYDIALVELSQLAGIDVDLAAFGHPERARAFLERSLMVRGLLPRDFASQSRG